MKWTVLFLWIPPIQTPSSLKYISIYWFITFKVQTIYSKHIQQGQSKNITEQIQEIHKELKARNLLLIDRSKYNDSMTAYLNHINECYFNDMTLRKQLLQQVFPLSSTLINRDSWLPFSPAPYIWVTLSSRKWTLWSIPITMKLWILCLIKFRLKTFSTNEKVYFFLLFPLWSLLVALQIGCSY